PNPSAQAAAIASLLGASWVGPHHGPLRRRAALTRAAASLQRRRPAARRLRPRTAAGGNRPCARAAAVPAPSAPGTPGAPARAGPRISVQSTAALRGGASLGAGAEVESPRAARGGGSRTAGSRQTSRTAPGARVQRASSDPRGTTQPARALHNARDADEMVMAE
ncbi:unnamed protein product, partial [Prorocentrum cordatum]